MSNILKIVRTHFAAAGRDENSSFSLAALNPKILTNFSLGGKFFKNIIKKERRVESRRSTN